MSNDRHPDAGSSEQKPTISVILSVRNEVEYIEAVLNDLRHQDAPAGSFEIIIRDGHSDDGTWEIAARWVTSDLPFEARALQHEKLQYPGINYAVSYAKGEWIQILDGHSRCPDGFITAVLKTIAEGKADVLGGQWVTKPGADNSQARAIAAAQTRWFGVGASLARTGGEAGPSDCLPFPCISRGVFRDIGLFRVEMLSNADTEFFYRAQSAGKRVYRHPRIQTT